MPVIDHEVHPSTVQGPEARYYCKDQPRRAEGATYPFWDREQGCYIRIPDRGSIDCQFDLSRKDAKCGECRWAHD